jgi:hypothetical protein
MTDSLSSESLPAGWVAAGAYRLGDVSLVAEAGGHYKTTDGGRDLRIHNFMGGLRFARDRNQRAVPFGQVLVGVACYGGTTLTFGLTSKRLAVQPGAGVDVALGDVVGVRVQGDYRYVGSKGGGKSSGQFRLAAGVVLRFWR